MNWGDTRTQCTCIWHSTTLPEYNSFSLGSDPPSFAMLASAFWYFSFWEVGSNCLLVLVHAITIQAAFLKMSVERADQA